MSRKRINKIPIPEYPEENNLKAALHHIKGLLKNRKSNHQKNINLKIFPLVKGQCFYIFNFQTGNIELPVGVQELLGYKDDELSTELFVSYFHPDDAPVVNVILKSIWEIALTRENSDWTSMQITFRARHKKGHYIKVLRQSRILDIDSNGRILSNITYLTDISFLDTSNHIFWELRTDDNRKLLHVENSIKKNISSIFTEREKQILKLLNQGLTSKEISQKLGTSHTTVDTQRRKLLKKTGCKNTTSLLEYARQSVFF